MLRHVCFKDPETFARVWNHAIYLKQPQYLRLRENAQGPGATLARLTDHLQWTLLPNGTVSFTDGCALPFLLLQGSILEMCLEATWTALIHAQISGTKRWGRVPPIDLCETRRCIRACGFIDRKLVVTHLMGSLRTTDMKSHWLPNEELSCPLCQGPLDDDHIVCRCPLLQTTRQPWEEFLHALTGDRRYLAHSPFCASLPESREVRASLISEQLSLECFRLPAFEMRTFSSLMAAPPVSTMVLMLLLHGPFVDRETAELWVQNDASAPSELLSGGAVVVECLASKPITVQNFLPSLWSLQKLLPTASMHLIWRIKFCVSRPSIST